MVITLRVRNPGDHAIDVYMRGRSPTFDVIISREDGATVWRRLHYARRTFRRALGVDERGPEGAPSGG